MSQAKVDRQKEKKANVKKNLKKKKIMGVVRIIIICIIAAGIFTWLGYSGYTKYKDYKAENPTYVEVNTDAIKYFSLSEDMTVDDSTDIEDEDELTEDDIVLEEED